MGELRKAGYDVKKYSSMKKEELRDYLGRVRSDIYIQAKNFCPDVLREICRTNREAKEAVFLYK